MTRSRPGVETGAPGAQGRHPLEGKAAPPGVLALACLEPRVGLVDDVDAALAPHQATVLVASLRRLERVADLHGPVPIVSKPRLLLAAEALEAAVELLDLAALDDLHVAAGPGRVRLRVDVEVQRVAFPAVGRARGERAPVGHDHRDLVVVGMDVRLHGSTSGAESRYITRRGRHLKGPETVVRPRFPEPSQESPRWREPPPRLRPLHAGAAGAPFPTATAAPTSRACVASPPTSHPTAPAPPGRSWPSRWRHS